MTYLDFWNRPLWLGDSRDHPGDPRHEPFWMREEEGVHHLPVHPAQQEEDEPQPDNAWPLGTINPVEGTVTLFPPGRGIETMTITEYREHLAREGILRQKGPRSLPLK